MVPSFTNELLGNLEEHCRVVSRLKVVITIVALESPI